MENTVTNPDTWTVALIGKNLAHFKVLEKLGTGGMGEVYVAEDTKLGRKVALKVLPRDLAADSDRRMRFEREARAIAALNHVNIVTIHSVEEAEGIPFLVMELVDGADLSDHIPKGGMRLPDLFRIAIPLAEALAAAHKQGITHRDLKPANVMITAEGAVKVLDFGLAKLMTTGGETEDATIAMQAGHTEEGLILGTVAYMSPEQAEGKTVDARTDIFSLGVLLYEMVTGDRPFAGDTRMSTITAILRDDPPSVTQLNRALPTHLGRIIKHCMAKKPEERYQSAIDVRNELRSLHEEITSGAHSLSEHSIARGPAPRSRRTRPVLLSLVGVVVVLGIVFGRSLFSPGSEAPTVRPQSSDSAIGVIGFENLSDPNDAEQIGRMLMGLVTTDLAESGGMNVVSSPKVLSALREVQGDGAFQSAIAASAAQKAGADVMLVGQVMRDGDGVILTAELIDVASGSAMGSIRKQTHSRSELFKLADALADEVRDTLGVATETEKQPAVDLAQTLTDSPAAYRAYIAGEAALQARLFEPAIEHLKQAVQLDSTFALAYHALAVAAGWEEIGALAKSASNQAVRWSDRLPERWRTVVRAKRDYEHENHDAAYTALQQLANNDTDIAEAYYLLGEMAEHVPEYVDADLARTSFEKALELDPSYTIVLFHLIDKYLNTNELEKAWDLIHRLEEQSPGDTAMLESKLKLLKYEDRLAEAETLAKELAVTNLTGSWMAIVPVFAWRDSLDTAERLLERVLATNNEDGFAISSLGDVRFLQGRFQEGFALKNKGIARLLQGSGLGVQIGRILADVAYKYAFAGDLDAAISSLHKSRTANPFFPPAAYLLGRLLAISGRDVTAHEAFAALDSMAAHRATPELELVRSFLQAELHLAQGQPHVAWRILEPIGPEQMAAAPSTQTWWWLRARVLEARGEREQALAAYRTIYSAPLRSSWQFMETRCLYPMAKLEEATGEIENARMHYRLYVKRWGAADVPIPGIDDARARLAALGG